MTQAQEFIDYYDILQVNPNCDAKILESAYRYLAKMYHPDHVETADVGRFNEVIEAYRVLRNPEQRAEYDQTYAAQRAPFEEAPRFPSAEDDAIDEATAVDDADVHEKFLMFLYRRRRESAQDAGVAGFYIQEMLNCSDSHFDFHAWYLKSKGYIETTEQGTLAITIAGVDHVIAMSRGNMTEKLLLEQLSRPENDPSA